MNEEKIHCAFSTDDISEDKQVDLSFVKHLMFDNEMGFLYGYGETSIFKLNLMDSSLTYEDRLQVHQVN